MVCALWCGMIYRKMLWKLQVTRVTLVECESHVSKRGESQVGVSCDVILALDAG